MGEKFKESLMLGLREAGIEIREKQLLQLEKYCAELVSWNEKINLTAIEEESEIAIKHFVDSVAFLPMVPYFNEGHWIDVGTGAGFPGLPLKIMGGMSKLTLLDSLQKRCLFLKHVVGELGLKEVNVIHGRAEEKGQDKKYREKFDGAMARAVTQLPVLAEYCLPLVRVGGLFISFKGPGVKEEIAAAEEAVFLLGGRFKKVEFYQLPVLGDQRSLVVIEKVAVSPEKYPRRPGVPEKKPLV